MSFAEYLARMVVVGLMSVSTSAVLLFCLYKFIRSREAAADLASLAHHTLEAVAIQVAGRYPGHAAYSPRFGVALDRTLLQNLQPWQPSNVGPKVFGQASISTASLMPPSYFVRRITEVGPPQTSSEQEHQAIAVVLA